MGHRFKAYITKTQNYSGCFWDYGEERQPNYIANSLASWR